MRKLMTRLLLTSVAVIMAGVIQFGFMANKVYADSVDLYCVLATGNNNWSDHNIWSPNADGSSPGHAEPTATNNMYPSSSIAANATLTVDVTASTLGMDWTGATNNPILALGTNVVTVSGNITTIAAMAITYTSGNGIVITANSSITSNGLQWGCRVTVTGSATLLGNFSTANSIGLRTNAGLITNGYSLSCTAFDHSGYSGQTVTLGNSIISCTSFGFNTVTVTANTAVISISGTGALAGGSVNYNGASFVTNGSAHTISGTMTGIDNFTRHPTSHVNSNTITFTSGTTITANNITFDGGARSTQLLAQSTTLGTAATIHATNWYATNTDFMDITAGTHLPDFSAQTDIGDAGGNTGITFPAAVPQHWITAAGGSFSGNNWSITTGGAANGRVPLAGIDNVYFDLEMQSAKTITWDVPRCGKSVYFDAADGFSGMSWTGTATTVQNTASLTKSVYGSLSLKTGSTWTDLSEIQFRGRGNYNLTTAGKTLTLMSTYTPTGTLTLQDDLNISSSNYMEHRYGTLDLNGKNYTGGNILSSYTTTRGLYLRTGTVTLSVTNVATKWSFTTTTGLTFDAGTSTIVLTNSGANSQTFTGGGLTYNNVTVAGAGNYILTRTGNNTYNTFTVDTSVAAKTLTSTGASTQTVADFVHIGTNTLTIQSDSPSRQWIKTGGGQIGLDYVSITNNTASPANTWYYGTHNTIGAGVTGWNAAAVPAVTSTSSSVISSTSASITGAVTEYNGFAPTIRGFEYDTDTGAPYALATNETGTFSTGSYSLTKTGLTQGTEYFYRAFATSAIGTGYGSELKFLTLPDEPTSLALAQGDLSLNLTWTNGAGRGTTYIVGKIGGYPANNTDGTLIYNGTGTDYLHTPLTYGDNWYYRAWSRTDIDGMTAWSATYAQATLGITGELVVTTQAADTILSTSALLHGTLTNYGNSVTLRGFDWDVNAGAPYANNLDEAGTFTTGVYSLSLTGLTEGTEYFARANATNVLGEAYGSEVKFLTRPGDVASFNITAGDREFNMTWTVGAGADVTVIWGKQSGYPSGVGDGVLIYSNSSDNYLYDNLTYGDTWYFKAWGYVATDGLTQYSFTPASATMTVTGLPIAPVTFTVVMQRDGTINGNFTKYTPTTTIIVMTKFGTYPANLTDGYEIYNSSSAYSFILPSLTDALYADGIDTTANFFSSPVWMSRIKYSAWARNSFGDSPTYATAALGGSETAPMTAAIEPVTSALTTVIDSITEIAWQLITLVLLMLFLGVSYWRQDKVLYEVSGLALTIFGLIFIATSAYFGIVCVVIGIYTTAKGLFQKA
jgi:hypothetical protein